MIKIKVSEITLISSKEKEENQKDRKCKFFRMINAPANFSTSVPRIP
ncbi:hypothetical protein HPS12939_1000 [Glaesserella parasuis 12939]|nr:hypothetical protein HPS12939_1000 [Glaesserella parasuis 12939]